MALTGMSSSTGDRVQGPTRRAIVGPVKVQSWWKALAFLPSQFLLLIIRSRRRRRRLLLLHQLLFLVLTLTIPLEALLLLLSS